MKKALLLSNGSVDLALALNRWTASQPEPIDLTVVHAYTLTCAAGLPLKADVYRQAKQQATRQLAQWLDFLPWSSEFTAPADRPGKLHAEILLGDPELVLTIHLLVRRYDYLLVDAGQKAALSAFMKCQSQIITKLCFLSSVEESLCLPHLMMDGAACGSPC